MVSNRLAMSSQNGTTGTEELNFKFYLTLISLCSDGYIWVVAAIRTVQEETRTSLQGREGVLRTTVSKISSLVPAPFLPSSLQLAFSCLCLVLSHLLLFKKL